MKDRPGRRFVRFHERSQPASYFSLAVGLALVVLGLLLSLTPGPGAPLVLIGIAMLAAQSRAVARALDRCEIRLRRLFNRRSGSSGGR